MDKLSIFSKDPTEVKITSEGGNNLDSVVSELKDIGRELLLQRKGQEAFIYDEAIEESPDVDLAGVPDKEVEDA